MHGKPFKHCPEQYRKHQLFCLCCCHWPPSPQPSPTDSRSFISPRHSSPHLPSPGHYHLSWITAAAAPLPSSRPPFPPRSKAILPFHSSLPRITTSSVAPAPSPPLSASPSWPCPTSVSGHSTLSCNLSGFLEGRAMSDILQGSRTYLSRGSINP